MLSLFALAGCAERDDLSESPYATGEPFVAEDAGRIPLTTPGTGHRVERPTIDFPDMGDDVPEPVPEHPEEIGEDTSGPAVPSVQRQQRAIDTIRFDSAQTAPLPLVRPPPPEPPAAEPPPAVARPRPAPLPAPPPSP
jgi:hypothetical protein